MTIIKGTLNTYFETGMEGVRWAMKEDDLEGYDALNVLDEGQRLVVYDNAGDVYWRGDIKKDLTTNLTDETFYPYPRQVANGLIIHWLQKDVNPEKWANMFFDEMRAELHLYDQI